MLTITDSQKLTSLGVKSTYNLDSGLIIVNLSPTEWIGSGNESGVVATIDILDKNNASLLSAAINPPMSADVSVAIPKQDGIYKWGTYTVKCTLNDGVKDYVHVVLFDLIPPAKPNKNTGDLGINIRPNRLIGKTGVFLSSPPPYKDADAHSYYETGTYYYPNGSGVADVVFTFSPIEVEWRLGRSEVQASSVATYVFDDNVYAIIKYTGVASKEIRALNDLCLAWAAIQDIIFKLSTYCEDDEREALFEKMDAALRLIVIISSGKACGYDTDDLEQELESLLGVGIGCNTLPESEIESLPAESIIIEGCGVTREQAGLTVRYKIENYQYAVSVSNGGSAIRQTNTTNGCTKSFGLTFDWAAISAIALTQFEGAYNSRFLNILNAALNNITVPSCVDTQSAWNAKSLTQKFQKVFDKQCECCGDSDASPSFNLELTCSAAEYTGSFSANGSSQSGSITIPIQVTGGAGNISASVAGNGFSGVLASTPVSGTTEEITVPIVFNGSGSSGIKTATVTIVTPTGTKTCGVQITVSAPAACTAPISPSVSISGSTVTAQFYPASNQPPAYEVKRRLFDAADVDGNYTSLPAPTYNVSTGKWTTTETFDEGETNSLWYYKFVSLCADEDVRPFSYAYFAALSCPSVTLASSMEAINYSFVPVGGDVNKYRIGLYLGSTLVGSIQTKTPPFASPITGSFTGLEANTNYTVKVFVEIVDGSTTYTKECSTDKSTTPQPTLTIGVVAAGGFSMFYAQLNTPVDADIILVNTFSDSFPSCGELACGSMQRVIPFTIPAGNLSGIDSYTVSSPITGVITNHNTVYPINVNGLPYSNNDMITIGSYSVLLKLQQCS